MATYSRKRPHSSSASSPLTAIPTNTLTSKRAPTTSTSSPMSAHKKPRLTQMTLDLGQKVHTRCKTCNMDYILSSDEDRRLHKKFHDAFVEDNEKGLPLTKATLERGRIVARFCPRKPRQGKSKIARKGKGSGVTRFFIDAPRCEQARDETPLPRTAEEQAAGQDTIIEIRPWDHWTLKHLAQRVLSVAETELGAVPIDEKQLWDSFSRDIEETVERLQNKKNFEDENTRPIDRHKLLMLDRYRVYLYVHEERAVGLLLAERIREGRVVLDGEQEEGAEEEERHDDFGRKKRKTMTTSTRSSVDEAATALPTPPPSSPPLPPAGLDLPITTSSTTTPRVSTTLIASTTPTPALLGISRIWVLHPFRSQSIAFALLETARRKMPYGTSDDLDETEEVSESFARGEIPLNLMVAREKQKNGVLGYEKCEVAFSQPTEAGRRLAERWWGERCGWLVYD